MIELDYAWAAGFFDGEGSITIHQPSAERSHRFAIMIGNTRIEPLLKMSKLFGGRVTSYRVELGKQPAWKWSRAGKSAIPALQAMLPYLVNKRVEAELALEFIATIRLRSNRWEPLRDDEIALRDKMAMRMKVLKRAESA